MSILADELRKNFEPVDPLDFYRDIFPDGELEEQGEYVDGKYCAIALEICYDKKRPKPKIMKNGSVVENLPLVRRYNVTNGLDEIDNLIWKNNNFCLMAPISYAGKTRESKNARFMYALCVEIDNLKVNQKNGSQEGLINLLHQIDNGVVPHPSYIVASGNGLHLYYLWDFAIPLFNNIVKQLKKYKRRLTSILWNKHITTTYQKEVVQQESIFQAFRMPGTITKNGDRVEVFRTGERVSIEYMNSFVTDRYKVDNIKEYKSTLSLAKAKELYPEWYEKRIVKGEPRDHWICNRGLYDWWKDRVLNEIKFGARYHGLKYLALYAIKCDISEEELRKDCYALKDELNKLTPEPGEEFTDYDVECAIQFFYDKDYIFYPVKWIAHYSKLDFPVNTRHHQKREWHLEDIRSKKENMKKRGQPFKNPEGRPKGSGTAEQKVKEWRLEHPDGKKADCIKELNLSKPTVYKWWGGETNE